MAEPSDYERGFAEGYDRGFDAGRNQQQNPYLPNPSFQYTYPLTGAAQPQTHFQMGVCSCPPKVTCASATCPRRVQAACGGNY